MTNYPFLAELRRLFNKQCKGRGVEAMPVVIRLGPDEFTRFTV